MKFLSGFLLLVGGAVYVNAFVGFLKLESAIGAFNWTVIDAFVGAACLLGSYLAFKESKIREYRATNPYKLSEAHRLAIREQQKSILAEHEGSDAERSPDP